jgi:hypothetical protein
MSDTFYFSMHTLIMHLLNLSDIVALGKYILCFINQDSFFVILIQFDSACIHLDSICKIIKNKSNMN